MAVPKKRTGHSKQGKRRSNWKASKPQTTKCPNCRETVLTHTVCTSCGTYKGKPVSLKDKVETPVVEEKKPAKKSTKKAAKTEEKVEEVKAEVIEETKSEEIPAETEKDAE